MSETRPLPSSPENARPAHPIDADAILAEVGQHFPDEPAASSPGEVGAAEPIHPSTYGSEYDDGGPDPEGPWSSSGYRGDAPSTAEPTSNPPTRGSLPHPDPIIREFTGETGGTGTNPRVIVSGLPPSEPEQTPEPDYSPAAGDPWRGIPSGEDLSRHAVAQPAEPASGTSSRPFPSPASPPSAGAPPAEPEARAPRHAASESDEPELLRPATPEPVVVPPSRPRRRSRPTTTPPGPPPTPPGGTPTGSGRSRRGMLDPLRRLYMRHGTTSPTELIIKGLSRGFEAIPGSKRKKIFALGAGAVILAAGLVFKDEIEEQFKSAFGSDTPTPTPEPSPETPEPSTPAEPSPTVPEHSPTPEPSETPEASTEPSPEPEPAPEPSPELSPEPTETPDQEPPAEGSEHDGGSGLGEAPEEPETIQREIGDWDPSTGEGSVEGTVRDYAKELGLDLNDGEVREAVEEALKRDKVGGENATMAERWEAAKGLQPDHKVTLGPDLFDLSGSTEVDPGLSLETDPAGEYLDENGNTHLNSVTHYQEGTPYNDIALKLHSEAAEKYGIEVDFSYLQKNNEYNHAYHNFVGNVLAENGLDWDSAKTDYHPGDTLRISDESLKGFVEKVADLTGQPFDPDQLPTEPGQPEAPDGTPGDQGEGDRPPSPEIDEYSQELEVFLDEILGDKDSDQWVADLSDEDLRTLYQDVDNGTIPLGELQSENINQVEDLPVPSSEQGQQQLRDNFRELIEAKTGQEVPDWLVDLAFVSVFGAAAGAAVAAAIRARRNRRAGSITTGGRHRPGRGRPPSAPRTRAPGRRRAPTGRRGAPTGP